MLVAVADELQSGVPVVGAPGLSDDLGLGGGFALFGALMTAPSLIGHIVEPAVLAWSDRADRRRLVQGALVAMGLLQLGAAMVGSGAGLALMLGLWGTACGVASGVAQGALVSGPLGPERGMARWTLGAVIGDLLAPVVLGVVGALGGGWRAGLALAALVPLVNAALIDRVELPPLVDEHDEEDEPLGQALREAMTDRTLLAWLVAIATCTLLDEILLALVALKVEPRGAEANALVGAMLVGGVVGGAALERLVARLPSRTLMIGASIGSAMGLLGFVFAERALVAGFSLGLLGVAAALLYPLAKARAYARRPDRPGMINALDKPLGVFEALAPLMIGAVASRWGLDAALLVLLLQPLAIGLAAWGAGRR